MSTVQFERPGLRVSPSLRQAHAGELMKRLGEPLIGGNRVDLLEDGPSTVEAMMRAIEGARDHVNLESCFVQADGTGAEIARRLADRCAAGVRVNLLLDSAGSPAAASTLFARLRRSGVSLCEANPVPAWRALAALGPPARDRRELMVVDGRIGFIGGVGMKAVPASGQGAGTACTDGRGLHVQVEGPVVHRLQRLFIAHWQRQAGAPMQQARYFRPLSPAGTHRVGVVAGDDDTRRDPYRNALLGAIDTARSRIMLTTAGPVPPRRLLRKLVQAAQRGVEVELLLPGVSDSRATLLAGRAQFAPLLYAGVRIHEQHGATLQAKACVIDGVWSSIGSPNADWRSLLGDAEANLVVLDEDFGARMEGVFRADAAGAATIDAAAWAHRSAWNRLCEAVARRFEFFP